MGYCGANRVKARSGRGSGSDRHSLLVRSRVSLNDPDGVPKNPQDVTPPPLDLHLSFLPDDKAPVSSGSSSFTLPEDPPPRNWPLFLWILFADHARFFAAAYTRVTVPAARVEVRARVQGRRSSGFRMSANAE